MSIYDAAWFGLMMFVVVVVIVAHAMDVAERQFKRLK